MADRDEGATVRLAATIARSRHEADGGTLLEGIHPDTIVEMVLAAKREVDSLRADLARVTAERDEAIEDRRQARDGTAHAAALLAVRTMERDGAVTSYRVSEHQREEACRDRDRAMAECNEARRERDKARSVGEAVLAVLEDFGWDLAVLRADIESDRLAETVEGCVMLAIERALRAHAAGSGEAKASGGVCECSLSVGGPHPSCIVCNGTGRTGGPNA